MSSVLWRWLGRAGHDAARIVRSGDGWRLEGNAAFVHDEQPVGLAYAIECDAAWRTQRARVHGAVGERTIDVNIVVDRGRWTMNDVEQDAVAGCDDVDLNFSPSTNTLPIRRLGLAVGESSTVRAAWLRFPGFMLEVLEQTYRRVAEDCYEYESAGGSFRAELTVTRDGLVIDYAGIWRADAAAGESEA